MIVSVCLGVRFASSKCNLLLLQGTIGSKLNLVLAGERICEVDRLVIWAALSHQMIGYRVKFILVMQKTRFAFTCLKSRLRQLWRYRDIWLSVKSRVDTSVLTVNAVIRPRNMDITGIICGL